MPRTPPVTDFRIHVDPSCLTSSSHSDMTPERTLSNETVVRHTSWAEHDLKHEKDKEEAMVREKMKEMERERQMDLLEQRIQAAAREVVASMEQDDLQHDRSKLGEQTEDHEGTERTEILDANGTELSFDISEGTQDFDLQTGEKSLLLHGEGRKGSAAHLDKQQDDEQDQHTGSMIQLRDDLSNHGDIDSDVFSRHSGNSSARSSFNPADSTCRLRSLNSPILGEEAHSASGEPVSRIPSVTSSHMPNHTPITPSRTHPRPAFRTPSSVRAIQMSSPTASIFSSPHSTKRHHPTVSRLGTPSSHSRHSSLSPTKKKPMGFKMKKEYPLVLLHITLLPISFPHQHILASPLLPSNLQPVRDIYRLLQEKIVDTVFERGILVPHPQDDYGVLEERLLEALELPVRPRARILKCGHYLGPSTTSDEEESDGDSGIGSGSGSLSCLKEDSRKWCDICGSEVIYDHPETGWKGGRRRRMFKVKVFASNGLMGAGTWTACWREMERVDVSIEPWIEDQLAKDLEDFATHDTRRDMVVDDCEEDFVADDVCMKERDFEDEAPFPPSERNHESVPLHSHRLARDDDGDDDGRRRTFREEARLREIWATGAAGSEATAPQQQQPYHVHHTSASEPGLSKRAEKRHTYTKNDSLLTLLGAALKVALRDGKNVVILILAAVVLLLALRPGGEDDILAIQNNHPATAAVVDGAVAGIHVVNEKLGDLYSAATSAIEGEVVDMIEDEKADLGSQDSRLTTIEKDEQREAEVEEGAIFPIPFVREVIGGGMSQ